MSILSKFLLVLLALEDEDVFLGVWRVFFQVFGFGVYSRIEGTFLQGVFLFCSDLSLQFNGGDFFGLEESIFYSFLQLQALESSLSDVDRPIQDLGLKDFFFHDFSLSLLIGVDILPANSSVNHATEHLSDTFLLIFCDPPHPILIELSNRYLHEWFF